MNQNIGRQYVPIEFHADDYDIESFGRSRIMLLHMGSSMGFHLVDEFQNELEQKIMNRKSKPMLYTAIGARCRKDASVQSIKLYLLKLPDLRKF